MDTIYAVCILIGMLAPTTWLFITCLRLNKELLESNLRVITLSSTLQKIEYATGKPWYTSSGIPIRAESPDWLYTHYSTKLNQDVDDAAYRRMARRR